MKSTFPFGYCTNVHAGTSLGDAQANLAKYAARIREQVAVDQVLPIGLWLAEEAALALVENQELLQNFSGWLADQGLCAYTFNGFPQGDFHQPVVKHKVYQPTWCEPQRMEYTQKLARIMAMLVQPDQLGSISTLPLGWPHRPWDAIHFKTAATYLQQTACFLEQLHQTFGREIVLAVEPEPGCVLNTAQEIECFFTEYLFQGAAADVAQRYLGVCHDICHSGVMFEPQVEALERYRQAGIRVGKVQVSSAVAVPWNEVLGQPELQAAMLAQLATFDEPKYLHQTTRRPGDGIDNTGIDSTGRDIELCEDLSVALQRWISPGRYPANAWRIHFHVPIFVARFGCLGTTQGDIRQAVGYLETHGRTQVAGVDWFTGHYEVETYAWPVLPPELAADNLADGIARELSWFQGVLRAEGRLA